MVRTRIGESNYYFRFYDSFPGDWDDIEITTTRKQDDDPLVVQYEAEVTYPRVRYETLYTTKANRIKTTDNFVRDEGVAHERYAFTGDVWQLRDTFFDVERTSVYRDKAWSPVQRRVRRVEQREPEYFVDKILGLFGGFGR